jgi:hypothetical protein
MRYHLKCDEVAERTISQNPLACFMIKMVDRYFYFLCVFEWVGGMQWVGNAIFLL